MEDSKCNIDRTTRDQAFISYDTVFMIDDNLLSDELRKNESLDSIKRTQYRGSFAIIVATILLVVVFVSSFCIGRYGISLERVMATISNGFRHAIWYIGRVFGSQSPEPQWLNTSEDTVVWLVRMHRILAAILVGSALSFSGATYQGLFRNPMVSPDILGASAGASVGACAMMLFYQNNAMIQAGAFVTGIIAATLSYLLSKAISKNGNTVLILVLCGMTVNALFVLLM